MQSVGVLVCGYNKEDAQAIKVFLDRTLEAYVILVSASQKADEKIIDILRGGPADCFADEETKILMFLGFTEVQTHMVLQGFPSGEGGLKRPIFCTLTARNQHWPLRELIEHLMEEHRRRENREDLLSPVKENSNGFTTAGGREVSLFVRSSRKAREPK